MAKTERCGTCPMYLHCGKEHSIRICALMNTAVNAETVACSDQAIKVQRENILKRFAIVAEHRNISYENDQPLEVSMPKK